jgi:hypothetical protein
MGLHALGRRGLVLGFVVACGEAARVTMPAALPSLPPPKPLDGCGIVERTQRVALEEPTACAPPRSRKFVTQCVRAGAGTWGLVIEDTDWNGRNFDCGALVERAEFGVVAPHFMARALYVDGRGHTSAAGPAMWWSTIEDVRAFDYDDDGVAELLVSATRSNEDGSSEHVPFETPVGAVWHARDGVVTSYTSIAVRSFADVDGDGRPDLITTRDFGIEAYDGDVTMYSFDGPQWVAHSLTDGTFSFYDAVASSFVKRSCADASLRTAGAPTLVLAAACARLSGASPKKIESDYVARCAALEARLPWTSDGNAACRVDANGTLSEKIAMPAALRKLLER